MTIDYDLYFTIRQRQKGLVDSSGTPLRVSLIFNCIRVLLFSGTWCSMLGKVAVHPEHMVIRNYINLDVDTILSVVGYRVHNLAYAC